MKHFVAAFVILTVVVCVHGQRLRLVRSPEVPRDVVIDDVIGRREHVVVARAAQYGYPGGSFSGSGSQASSHSGSFGGGLGGFGGSGSQSSAQSSAGSNSGGFGGYGYGR